MLTPRQHQIGTALGAAAIALVLLNGTLFVKNRETQAAINARQANVQQAAQLELLQRDIAKALADLALKSGDRKVLDMLARNGITVTMNTTAAASPTGGAAR